MWTADDHYVIALTYANLAQYSITEDVLAHAMNHHPKAKTALICICEESEAAWWVPHLSLLHTPGADTYLTYVVDRVKRHFPGHAFLVTNSADIPKVLRGFLSTMVDR